MIPNYLQEYVKNAVIPPPETSGEVVKYTRIAVDSKDRKKDLHPYPNSYEIKLPDEYSDVISAKLINADIPMSLYLVNKYFDTITLFINNTTYDVALEHGDYNEADFATMVTSKLNEVITDNFAVTYSLRKDGFVFASKLPFSLIFGSKPNSLDALLGFKKQQYNSISIGSTPYTHVVSSEYRKNFSYNNCVIMYIDQFDTYHSPTNEMDHCFAILPSVYNNLSISDHPELIKTFSPPIPRLTRLIVKFLDRYGNPYDFQNMEHRYEIILTSHKQARKYNSIFGN